MSHSAKKKKVSGNVVIVFIGDETLKLIGKWPISREWYAEFTGVMKEYGAKVIAYDIVFPDPSSNETADIYFSESIKNAGNVIIPYSFSALAKEKYFLESKKIYRSLALLENSAKSTGFINCPTDIDGVTRRYPLFIKYKNKLYPSLGISVIKDYYGISDTDITVKKGKYVEFNLRTEKIKIPVDNTCSVLMNFYPSPDLKKFPHYSFIQVMQSYIREKRGKVPLIPGSAFKDKIVIIGYTASGTSDVAAAPNFPVFYGMGLHANFIENFLKREFIKKTGPEINFGIPFVLSFILTVAVVSISPWLGLIIMLVTVGIFLFFSSVFFNTHFLWIEVIPGISIVVFSYAAMTITQFVFEKRDKMKIKTIFQKYVSPAVMEKLLSYPETIPLGGEKKNLTVLFADIRGFTPIAEKISPEQTVELLNKIFNVMVDAVFKYGGTLDKFIGDAIMVIYGAPVEVKNHAMRAVLSSIEMVKNIRKLYNSNETPVNVGIGINTGAMVIGNIGSNKRLEYTAIGDAVNLSSRIQTMAEGGKILMGEATYSLVKDEIPCEFLGAFKVKGKDVPVNVYEVRMEEENEKN